MLQPWLFAGFALLPSRKTRALLSGYVLASACLLIFVVFRHGQPTFIQLAPPKVHDLSGRFETYVRHANGPTPTWLLFPPPTSHGLARHHGKLMARLEPETFVLTNKAGGIDKLFIPYLRKGAYGRASLELRESAFNQSAVEAWLAQKQCTMDPNMAVVLFTWDRWAENSAQLEEKIDRQCPNLVKESFTHSIAYFPVSD